MRTSTRSLNYSISLINLILLSLGMSETVRAVTFSEIGDAGTFPTTGAQIVQEEPGEILESITGTFTDWFDVDIFQLELEAGVFTASTQDGIEEGSVSLFLFDSNGLGLAANTGNEEFAVLEGLLPETGTYFLGIGGGRNYQWSSSEGAIFSASDFSSRQFGATGVGAGLSPTSVSRSSSTLVNSYEILLDTTTEINKVPEPASILSLLVFGGLGLVSRRNPQKRKRS